MKISAFDLRLGDVVKLNGEYSFATVKNIKVHIKERMLTIYLFRPYVKTENFTYSGGVICYVGIDESSYYCSPDDIFEVCSRKNFK